MLPRSRSGALVAALVLGWGILGVVDAAAAPPRNDDFRDAKVIDALPFEHQINTRDATTENTDPRCAGRKHTVWYSFTATKAGRLIGSTAGSNYDTTLSVYTGTRRNLKRFKCNDDTESSTSVVAFGAAAGETYHFMVASSRKSKGGSLVFGLAGSCLGEFPTIIGTPGDDLIEGTRGHDVISGLEGNDTIVGGGGRDEVCGDEGNDTIEDVWRALGQDGDDHITTRPQDLRGAPELRGGHGNDTLIGGFSSDRLEGGRGDDVMRGNEGFDSLFDPYGSNEFYGGWDGDEISPGRETSVIVGGPGSDLLNYNSFFGINGIDVDLAAGTVLVEDTFAQSVDGVERVFGTSESDTFRGDDGDNDFVGIGGRDTFDGGSGDDSLLAPGDDLPVTMSGSDGDDFLSGSNGNDQLSGDAGDDFIEGGPGADNIDGGAGVDSLNGGHDSDSCLNGERIINCE